MQLEVHEFTQVLGLFSGKLHCSDPCDRLYALLSPLSQKGRDQLAIEPDCSQSTFDLLKDVVKSYQRYPPSRDPAKVMEAVHTVRKALQLKEDHFAVKRLLSETIFATSIVSEVERE